MDTAGRIAAAAPELAARLASFVARERLPGAAAGVVCGDELAWLAGAGLADLATGKATDPAMRYGIASVSVFFLDFTWVRLDRVTA
jgi:CubicO group peptidase (beta-lactamase class C family)